MQFPKGKNRTSPLTKIKKTYNKNKFSNSNSGRHHRHRHRNRRHHRRAHMGAGEPVEEREMERKMEEGVEENGRNLPEERRREDLEKGEKVGELPEQQVMERDINNTNNQADSHISMLHRLNPTNPLRIIINGGGRVATPPPQPPSGGPTGHHHHHHQSTVPRSIATPQQPAVVNLNSKAFTDKVSLFLFVLHLVLSVGLVCFLVFKGIQGLLYASNYVKRKEMRVLQYFLPQVEVASVLSISLAFGWQKAVRLWPKFMVHFILWCSFAMTLSAGILLVCFQMPATEGVGVCFLVFAIGNGLYACWVTQRIQFCSEVFVKSLEPVSKFPDLNQPTYWMLGAGFVWISIWILAVIGALNFYLPPPLTIIALVLSLAWTAEVMRNVANITVSRVIALYYLRGIQSNTRFCLQRALTRNLGSASLGSLFVPTIEALRILARGLNLLEGEDEFMFSCAHCCLNVMNSIFRRGNSWAFVQIGSYGKDFVRASQDIWKLFEMTDMVQIVDSDITSSICFLTGVCSGSICVIVIASWTFTVHRSFTATISLLSFIVGYLMTRIAMALPHACVSCYYVCYAENPGSQLFDATIKNRQDLLKSNRDVAMTPRMPRRK